MRLTAACGKRIKPHQDLVRRLCTIPGVKEITAWTLIAELGTDMSQFPTAAHVASWAGCVRAIARARANDNLAIRAKGTAICDAC